MAEVFRRFSAKDYILAGGIFIVGALLLFPGDFFVSWDLSTYLVYANNLVSGQGFSDAAWRPVSFRPGFVLFLAGLQVIWPGSMLAVALFEVVFAASLVALVFLCGMRFWGRASGVIAASLLLTSPDVIFWLPRHLDQIWPALLLLAAVVLSATPEYRDTRVARVDSEVLIGLAAGAIGGAAVFFHELSVSVLLVPLIAALMGVRAISRRRLMAFLVAAAVVGTAALGVGARLGAAAGSVRVSYGSALESAAESSGAGALVGLLLLGLDGLWRYFLPSESGPGIASELPLFAVMAVAMAWRFRAAWRGSNGDRVLIATLATLAPHLAISGQLGLRFSQVVLLILCLLFALAASTVDVVDALLRRFARSEGNRRGVVLAAACVSLACFQLLMSPRGVSDTLNRNVVARWIAGAEPFVVTFRGAELAQWFEARLRPGETIMVSHIATQHGVAWHLSGHRVETFPYRQVAQEGFEWVYFEQARVGGRFAAASVWNRPGEYLYIPFFLYSEEVLANTVSTGSIRYVAVSPVGPDRATLPLLEDNPGLVKVAEVLDAGLTFSVFRVDGDLRTPGPGRPLRFDADAVDYLNWLSEVRPDHFEWYRTHLLNAALGLSDAAVERLLAKQSDAAVEIVP